MEETMCPVPLSEPEQEVWFYSGYRCQIYLESSHAARLIFSHSFFFFVVVSFLIFWYPALTKEGAQLVWKNQFFPLKTLIVVLTASSSHGCNEGKRNEFERVLKKNWTNSKCVLYLPSEFIVCQKVSKYRGGLLKVHTEGRLLLLKFLRNEYLTFIMWVG